MLKLRGVPNLNDANYHCEKFGKRFYKWPATDERDNIIQLFIDQMAFENDRNKADALERDRGMIEQLAQAKRQPGANSVTLSAAETAAARRKTTA